MMERSGEWGRAAVRVEGGQHFERPRPGRKGVVISLILGEVMRLFYGKIDTLGGFGMDGLV